MAASGPLLRAATWVGQSRANYPYLTVDSVRAKLRPAIAAQLPAAADSRLVILNANFRAAGRSDRMVRLDPAGLEPAGGPGSGTGSADSLDRAVDVRRRPSARRPAARGPAARSDLRDDGSHDRRDRYDGHDFDVAGAVTCTPERWRSTA